MYIELTSDIVKKWVSGLGGARLGLGEGEVRGRHTLAVHL